MESGENLPVTLEDLREDMNEFSANLKQYSDAAEVSSTTIFQIIARIRERANVRHIEIKERVTRLEQGIAQIQCPSTPPLPSHATATTSQVLAASSEIDGERPLGIAQIGGTETVITANYLFGLIRDLQAKLEILTERSKNTGVIFQHLAFSSEAEFGHWFVAHNPEGSGLAGFVDLVSIWTFVSNEPGEMGTWLNAAHKAKAVGLKGGSADATYAHSMTRRYPTAFIGSDNKPILSTTTINMLESYDAWRGTISGDGQKEKLTNDLQRAVHSHRTYCEAYLPAGPLREAAIKTAKVTLLFWTSLVSYIEDEYQLLKSFNLLPKHVLLLLSNQLVQICDDMFEFRNCASNVDLQNPLAAATRYAWVTLQSLGTMDGYLSAKFRLHQAINSTFIRFLTRHMADQTGAGLKGIIDGLKTTVAELEKKVKNIDTDGSKKVTQEMFNHLESKLENVITANNLRKNAPRNNNNTNNNNS